MAEILLLDQLSRNLYRDDPRAFACDGAALVCAQELQRQGHAQALPPSRRAFACMPYMHSESRTIQAQSVRLFEALGAEQNLDSARRHQAVIERFGRFPHRNAALGRVSTPAEIEFLREPGSRF